MTALEHNVLLVADKILRHILVHKGTCRTDDHSVLLAVHVEDVAGHKDGVVLHIPGIVLGLLEIYADTAAVAVSTEDAGIRIGIVQEAAGHLDDL